MSLINEKKKLEQEKVKEEEKRQDENRRRIEKDIEESKIEESVLTSKPPQKVQIVRQKISTVLIKKGVMKSKL